MAISSMPIFGAGELKLFLLVKRRISISLLNGGVYFMWSMWFFLNQYNNIHLLEKPGGRHICLGYL